MNFLSRREIWSHVLLRALSLAPDHCSHPQRKDGTYICSSHMEQAWTHQNMKKRKYIEIIGE